ncbi:M20/M25/M40 family metallo-hydrolase [Bacteroidota bacterium]
MKFLFLYLFLCFAYTSSFSQNDEKLIRSIYDEALTNRTAYENLRYLTKNFKGRIACAPEAIKAAFWAKEKMDEMDLDTVFMQEMMVVNWIRGDIEEGTIISEKYGQRDVEVCALGLAVGTGSIGLKAKIIEISSRQELEQLGRKNIEGKIVFFNEALDNKLINTFGAYGKAAWQRTEGPSLAAGYGAKAAVIRSLTASIDKHPHTGVTRYAEGIDSIPAIAICTEHAELLSKWLKNDPDLEFYFKTMCLNLPETKSYNAIGEIRGSKYPDEYIVIGGHLDAWDNSEGAHDDGGGCMQSIEILRIFKTLGIKPERSIRAVMFMDEEISQRGGAKYADEVRRKGEKHIVAMEADRGCATPVGFTVDASAGLLEKIQKHRNLLSPYGINFIARGGGGVDIGPLKQFNTVLIGLVTDNHRYFDWHHSPNDSFEQINIREFQMGSAAMASLTFLLDKYLHN